MQRTAHADAVLSPTMRKIDLSNFSRATQSTSRDINRQIVLNLVHEHQPISRAALARRMNVSRGKMTSLVGELLAEGVIVEGETADTPRGRKPRMLYVRTRDRLVVAIDIRFNRTWLRLSDFAGTEIALDGFETRTDPSAMVAELAARVDRVRSAHADRGECEGVGLVVPGMVDPETGRVLNAPQLGWRNVDIRGALEEAVGLPVSIENAPLACALARMWLRSDGGSDANFVYVTVAEGVGAGVVTNGQLVRGASFAAGEFGHVPVEPDGRTCLCGARGCLEAHTSNLATIARYLHHEGKPSELRDVLQATHLTVSELIDRARAGDAGAGLTLDETGRYLGLGLAMIVNALNPARIWVGGEITAAWDRIAPLIRREIESRGLTPATRATPVEPDDAAYPRLRGATALVTAPVFAAPTVA